MDRFGKSLWHRFLPNEENPFIIADAAGSLRHTLRSLEAHDEDEATMGNMTGLNLNLARSITQVTNRIHGQSTQSHPFLERVLGPRISHEVMLQILASWFTPALLRKAELNRTGGKLKKDGARGHFA